MAIWVESYPVCSHVTLPIVSMYSADDETKEEKRKEEGEKRRILDTDDRISCEYILIEYEELKKHSHPLKRLVLASITSFMANEVVNASVNVQETLKTEESMFLPKPWNISNAK